jgi:polar amino acid transport system substrate-binding protein
MSTPSSWSRVAIIGLLLGAGCTSVDPAVPGVAVAADDADGQPVAELADETPDALTLVTAGVLTVCANVPLPPFTYEDPAAATGYGGFDVDLAAEIAERLELTLAVVAVAFEDITSGAVLTENRCDVAASALTVTDEWTRHLGFTAPYFEVKQSLVVRDDAPPMELLASGGMRLGVQTGTPAERFAEREAPAEAEVVLFANTTDLLAALSIGDVDAVIQDLPTSTTWVAAELEVAVVETFVTEDVYAMAVGAGREDALLRLVDAQLATIRDDGTRDLLLAEHFAMPAGADDDDER